MYIVLKNSLSECIKKKQQYSEKHRWRTFSLSKCVKWETTSATILWQSTVSEYNGNVPTEPLSFSVRATHTRLQGSENTSRFETGEKALQFTGRPAVSRQGPVDCPLHLWEYCFSFCWYSWHGFEQHYTQSPTKSFLPLYPWTKSTEHF